MDKATRSRLLQINQTFYDQYAVSFSATRGRVQPGVNRILEAVSMNAAILDIGCGNGTLAQALEKEGFRGQYLGVDMSDGLLTKARERMELRPAGRYEFTQADLADPGWADAFMKESFDWVTCFAVLHHLPGGDLRRRTAQAFAGLVSPKGRAAVSVWQWQNSPRLRKRVLTWSEAGIDPASLDEGDVLLDWRAGEQVGLRYVHTFSENSMTALAEGADFEVRETYSSDGKPGNLALYQVWELK